MGLNLFRKMQTRRPKGQRLDAAICGEGSKSQANPPVCRRVKSYPGISERHWNGWNGRARSSVLPPKQKHGGIAMYIGLGGLLILILVLWLLGVI
jgi:hypothetical protein